MDRLWLEFSAVIPGWEERRDEGLEFSDAQKAFIRIYILDKSQDIFLGLGRP